MYAKMAAMAAGSGITWKTVLYFCLGGFLIYLAFILFKSLKSGMSAAGDVVGNTTIAAANGVNINRVEVCRTVATSIYDAMPAWWSFNYNEEVIIKALNTLVSREEVALTDSFLKEKSGKTLTEVIDACFDDSDLQKLKAVVRNYVS